MDISDANPVFIFAGHKGRRKRYFKSNGRLSFHVASHIHFTYFRCDESRHIARSMLQAMQYCFDAEAEYSPEEYSNPRMKMPRFLNAHCGRNALPRVRLGHKCRLRAAPKAGGDYISFITFTDLRASYVFAEGQDTENAGEMPC